jgi:hypothetical protein
LTDEWKALRFINGNSVIRFLTEYTGLIDQIDHAAGAGESKMTNKNKCWQLTKAFGSNPIFNEALGPCTTRKRTDSDYPQFETILTRIKNTVQNKQEPGTNSQGVKIQKKGKIRKIGDKKPGNKNGKKAGNQSGTQGARGKKIICYKCGKNRTHYARECNSPDVKCDKCILRNSTRISLGMDVPR